MGCDTITRNFIQHEMAAEKQKYLQTKKINYLKQATLS